MCIKLSWASEPALTLSFQNGPYFFKNENTGASPGEGGEVAHPFGPFGMLRDLQARGGQSPNCARRHPNPLGLLNLTFSTFSREIGLHFNPFPLLLPVTPTKRITLTCPLHTQPFLSKLPPPGDSSFRAPIAGADVPTPNIKPTLRCPREHSGPPHLRECVLPAKTHTC